jgi:hypothetical protein
MELGDVRNQLLSFLVESEDLYWQNWIGVQDQIDIAALYAKYSGILSIETLAGVQRRLRNESDPEKKQRLQALYGALTLGYLEFRTSRLQQHILKKEAETAVEWHGETIPLRSFGVRILNEPSRDIRMEMIEKKEEMVTREINPVRIDWIQDLFLAIRELGYADYIDLCQETQNRDFHAFYEQTESFLEKSESIYRSTLDEYLRKLAETSLHDRTHNADLTAVFRCAIFDDWFPGKQLIPTLKNTLSPMGFTLDKIHFDMEDRPKKKPRACVSAVNPPDDVRLTVYPLGGYEDYAGLLHETGHAVHFIHEKSDLDFEYKFWGDRGFTEGTAYLFQNITMNEIWLKEMIRMDDPTEFIRFNAFLSILRLRRLIGQFRYQYDLFKSASTDKMADVYKTHMERSHAVIFEPSGYLNFDLEFYSAGYVRARLFELQLRSYLVETFGRDWWRNPQTGQFLIPLYREGRKPRADDVVNQLGFNDLDMNLYLTCQLNLLSEKI